MIVRTLAIRTHSGIQLSFDTVYSTALLYVHPYGTQQRSSQLLFAMYISSQKGCCSLLYGFKCINFAFHHNLWNDINITRNNRIVHSTLPHLHHFTLDLSFLH